MARKYNKRTLSAKSHATREQQQKESHQLEMETVDLPGMLLRKKRLAMQLSLSDVADKLKIKAEILEKIEQDNIYNDMHLTHIRGFLRKYVTFLGENSDDFMALIKERKGIGLHHKPHHFKPPQPISNRTSHQWIIILLSVVIVLVIIFIWQKNFLMPKTNIQEQSPPNFTSLIAPTQNSTINTTQTAPLVDIEQQNLNAAEKPNVAHQEDDIKATNISVINSRLIAVEDVWLIIFDGNKKEIYQDILKENNMFDISKDNNEIYISTNSAGSLIYENSLGQKMPLGEKNEILDNYMIKIQ